MITSIKRANADKYTFLYDKATEFLLTHDEQGETVERGGATAIMKNYQNDAGETVEPKLTSLEEYFSYIVELSKLDKTYTILPLDEEAFEIDANTRVITVPDSFKNNGISVQGDEIAEIVYFRANRYFDSTDLSLKDIYIQCVAADATKGVSTPWVVDIDSEPGYIIFGWPLSTAITSAPGSISFSVRFYSINETSQKIEYSLSTLTANAVIKEALSYNLTSLVTDNIVLDDSSALIAGRFENTTPGNSTAVAKEPEFILDFDDLEDNLKSKEETIDGIDYVYASLAENAETGYREVPFWGAVEATSEDAGNITYAAQKLNLNKDAVEEAEVEVEMIETTDTERQSTKLYYYKVEKEDGTVAYKLYTKELDPDIVSGTIGSTSTDGKIYEKVFKVKVDEVGYYTVTATNRVRTATAKNNSKTLVIPAPEQPVINTDLENTDVIEAAKEYALELSVQASCEDRAVLTYQWFHIAPGTEEPKEIEGATSRVYSITGWAEKQAIESETEPGVVDHYEYIILNDDEYAEGDGYYYCVITNHLNGVEVTRESNRIKVTHEATAPVIEVLSKDSYALSEIETEEITLKIAATIPEDSGENVEGWRDTETDSIEYEWYRYYFNPDVPGASVDEDIQKSIDGTYVIKTADKSMWGVIEKQITDIQASIDNGLKDPVEGAAEIEELREKALLTLQPEFDPSEAGYYFCKVTNKYNGTEAVTLSRFFTISIA